MEDCRNCKQYESCPCGEKGHENGTSIGYSIGECKAYELKEANQLEVKKGVSGNNSGIDTEC